MYGNKKWHYLQNISKPYALDILDALLRRPMRFSELRKICLSQKTLTVRLRELEELDAISKVIENQKGKKIKVHYALTRKGKETIETTLNLATVN